MVLHELEDKSSVDATPRPKGADDIPSSCAFENMSSHEIIKLSLFTVRD